MLKCKQHGRLFLISKSYSDAVALASKVLAARKATRDFTQIIANPYAEEFMIPKSSLDGARETVLKEDKKHALSNQTRAKLGLSASEQLDCLGIVKRLGLKNKRIVLLLSHELRHMHGSKK
jgi:CRISPR-associated protein Cmr2